jgi:hypothetical protein
MLKDVECTFGIMKGRWRILKTGIIIYGTECAGKIWLTCCALHNWLLEVDGLNEPWDPNINNTSPWESSLGEFESNELPNAVVKALSPSEVRNYDMSGMGPGKDVETPGPGRGHISNLDNSVVVRARHVHNLSLKDFRAKLIEHFDIKYGRHEIVWPTYRGNIPLHI